MDHYAQLRGRAKDFEKQNVKVFFVWPTEVAYNRQWLSGRDTWTKTIGEWYEDKEPLKTRPYLRDLGSGPDEIDGPVLADPSLTTSADYGVAMQNFNAACNYPTTYIIDRAGIVRWKHRDTPEFDRPGADLLLKTIENFDKK
jgi:alkyl hydroperoxide reductase subunit AhpC